MDYPLVLDNGFLGDKFLSACGANMLPIGLGPNVFLKSMLRCDMAITKPANVAGGLRRKPTIGYTLLRVVVQAMLFQSMAGFECFVTSVKAAEEFR